MELAAPRIVICGAGIAGVAAAYQLAVVHGCRHVTLVEADTPLSMTSDKSTESYRNWWPGPDAAMTRFMNHSIDLLEQIAGKAAGRINLNRRGYAFATAEIDKLDWLVGMARTAESHGAGPVRVHGPGNSAYRPSPEKGYAFDLTGADIITSPQLIREHFPCLTPETRIVAHARRAGWLSAQQLGMVMLEAAREAGTKLVRGRVLAVETRAGEVSGVSIARDAGAAHEVLPASHVVLAAGPLLDDIASRTGVTLPIFAERHLKISFSDSLGVIPRASPMLIWLDAQSLPWTNEERAILRTDDATRWLTDPFPAGVHGRPDGGADASTVLALFNYENHAAEVVFPLPEQAHYAEIALRGMSTMVPGLAAYVEKGIRPYVDGGYYMKTRENRPLIGPTSTPGLFVSGAYSGFGIMASCAGADLIARHVLGASLPDYASAFLLTRYRDPEYMAMLDNWGDGGQL